MHRSSTLLLHGHPEGEEKTALLREQQRQQPHKTCSLPRTITPYLPGILHTMSAHLTNLNEQVDHWALGERELMCQWRVATRHAAMCGGTKEVETSGMMALSLWTSEDGRLPSVDPKPSPATWAVLRSPEQQRPDSPSQSEGSGVMSPSTPSSRVGVDNGLRSGVGGMMQRSSSDICLNPAGALRCSSSSSSGGAKRSRLELECGGSCATIGSSSSSSSNSANTERLGIDAARGAQEEETCDEPWLNSPRRERQTAGDGRNRGRGGGRDDAAAARSARCDREPPAGGGSKIDSNEDGTTIGDRIEEGRSSIPRGDRGTPGRFVHFPPGVGGGGGGCDDCGGRRAPSGGGSGGSVSGRRGKGPLGKVVGIPRQAKAQDVRIVYDACSFIRELEVSYGERQIMFVLFLPPYPQPIVLLTFVSCDGVSHDEDQNPSGCLRVNR